MGRIGISHFGNTLVYIHTKWSLHAFRVNSYFHKSGWITSWSKYNSNNETNYKQFTIWLLCGFCIIDSHKRRNIRHFRSFCLVYGYSINFNFKLWRSCNYIQLERIQCISIWSYTINLKYNWIAGLVIQMF